MRDQEETKIPVLGELTLWRERENKQISKTYHMSNVMK